MYIETAVIVRDLFSVPTVCRVWSMSKILFQHLPGVIKENRRNVLPVLIDIQTRNPTFRKISRIANHNSGVPI
jgi:hypothetical protein